MTRTFESIVKEADEFSIRIKGDGEKEPIMFIDSQGTILSWMWHLSGRIWTGHTNDKKITGIKRGTRGQVADWCLDWAVNGL